MTEQVLIPFKAKFILTVKTTMKNFFENSGEISLKEKLSEVADEIGSVDISKVIKHYYFTSKLYKQYNTLLNYHKAFDVTPSNMLIDETDFSLNFKLDSSEIEVLQIIGNKITFADSSKMVQTIEQTEDLKLIKV